jgi:hypothetical protein
MSYGPQCSCVSSESSPSTGIVGAWFFTTFMGANWTWNEPPPASPCEASAGSSEDVTYGYFPTLGNVCLGGCVGSVDSSACGGDACSATVTMTNQECDETTQIGGSGVPPAEPLLPPTDPTDPTAGLGDPTQPPPGWGGDSTGPDPITAASGGASSGTSSATSGTSEMATFCTDNPQSPLCLQGAVSGSCGTFQCTGDPVQCQIAAATEAIRCQGLTPTANPSGITSDYLGKLNATGLDGILDSVQQGPDDPGFWSVGDWLPSFLPAGGCSDYSFVIANQTFTLPLGQVANFFPSVVQWIVNVLTAFLLAHIVLAKPSAAS